MKRTLNPAAASFLGVCALLLAPVAHATVSYHVTINTAPLASLPASGNGPFYLDFKLSNGNTSSEGNNTVTLQNFTFGGGGAVGSASLFPVASGDLGGTVSLTDSNAISEFYQQFTPGSTIGFDVTSTTNTDPGLVHDLFTGSILDSSLGFPSEIGTNSTNTLDLLEADINSTLTGNTVQYFQGTGVYAGVSAIPEPGTAVFGLGVIGAMGLARRRKASV